MFYYLVDACAVVCALACINRLRAWRKHRMAPPFPPGPPGFPVIGNALDMQDPEVWEAARKWGEKYGPLVHVEAFGHSLIFVNSYKAAVELFEKRGNIYSSRPKNTMIELEGWDWVVSIMPYGDELRRSRQLLHRFLQPAMMDDYTDLQTQSVYKLLDRLLNEPDKFPELLRHAMGETIIKITYGYQAQEKNDPYIEIAEKGIAAAVLTEEPFLINLVPSLQYLPSWLPGAGFKKVIEEGRKASQMMYNEPYEMAKTQMNKGTAMPSVFSKLQDAYAAGDAVINDESLIKKVAGVMYGAGADTTVSALHTFFLAMVLYPNVQQRAQEELDRVLGKDVLPTFDDRPNLPYINAVVKETLRWQPVTPLAVAHVVDQDDVFEGYTIPKGAALFPNTWAMQRDAEEYPNPNEFVPERWLPQDGGKAPLDVHNTFFGHGRRLCPGRHFADNTVFIGAASLLAAFNITKALDSNGVPITPPGEYTPHFVRHPKPFRYALSPRSGNVKEVVRQALDTFDSVPGPGLASASEHANGINGKT